MLPVHVACDAELCLPAETANPCMHQHCRLTLVSISHQRGASIGHATHTLDSMMLESYGRDRICKTIRQSMRFQATRCTLPASTFADAASRLIGWPRPRGPGIGITAHQPANLYCIRLMATTRVTSVSNVFGGLSLTHVQTLDASRCALLHRLIEIYKALNIGDLSCSSRTARSWRE